MFPRPESRLKTVFRRSLDAAIDFATLGEYGYAPAWGDAGVDGELEADWGFDGAWARGAGASTAALERPAGAATATAALVPPASAAGRARVNAERRADPVCAGQPTRGRALAGDLPRTSRHRDGMAPREQHCAADAT